MQKVYKSIIALAVVVIVAVSATGLVSAQGNATDNGQSGQGNSTTNGSENSGGLSDEKKRACENSQANISAIMSRVANRATKRLQLFDDITEKVKNLYSDKNITLANYDTLLANIAAARTAVQNAIQTEHTMTAQFSCDSEDPKGSVSAFKNQQKTELKAMQQYREAIKALVSSIKTELESLTDGEQ